MPIKKPKWLLLAVFNTKVLVLKWNSNGVFFFLIGKSVDETPDVWKLAAITSFSVLAVVLVSAALIIGVMVHRRKSHKRPLRGKTQEKGVSFDALF